MAKIRILPWFDDGEWDHVRNLVLARNMDAMQYFQVWKSRSLRLPAGVEATVSLLEASTQFDNSLSLSMAINRFLNHISHLGMNVWGLSKLHSAAEKLGVPSWVVDIRHDSTHGQMPGITILRAGYEACWSWISLNYWQQKTELNMSHEYSVEEKLSKLLDLYLYLKVYHTWGTANIKDIATSDDDVYSHVRGIWSSVATRQKNGASFPNMSVKQAQGIVKSEILALDVEPELLARVLVEEDLLVPEHSFLESMLEDEEEDHVEVPKDLLAVWKEFIERIDEKIGAKFLINLIVEKISNEAIDENCREFCASWVVELSEALLGRSKTLQFNKKHNSSTADLEVWISKPNRLIQMLLPCFYNLVGLEKKKQVLLDDLVAAAVGDQVVPGLKLPPHVLTVESLGCDVPETKHAGDRGRGWRREKSKGWGDQLIRTYNHQSWTSLWLPASAEWLEAADQGLDEDKDPVPELEVGLAVWPGQAPQVADTTQLPAFYKNQNQRIQSPRRKKVRKH